MSTTKYWPPNTEKLISNTSCRPSNIDGWILTVKKMTARCKSWPFNVENIIGSFQYWSHHFDRWISTFFLNLDQNRTPTTKSRPSDIDSKISTVGYQQLKPRRSHINCLHIDRWTPTVKPLDHYLFFPVRSRPSTSWPFNVDHIILTVEYRRLNLDHWKKIVRSPPLKIWYESPP